MISSPFVGIVAEAPVRLETAGRLSNLARGWFISGTIPVFDTVYGKTLVAAKAHDRDH